MLRLAFLVFPFLLSVACASDDHDHHGGLAGFAGQPAAAGSGGQNEAETGGAGAENAPDIGAEARQALCERICATEAELPCAKDSVECVKGWCPVIFPRSCQDEFDLMLNCVADEPVTSFLCIDTDAFPRDTVCVDEQTALAKCFQE